MKGKTFKISLLNPLTFTLTGKCFKILVSLLESKISRINFTFLTNSKSGKFFKFLLLQFLLFNLLLKSVTVVAFFIGNLNDSFNCSE